MKNVSRRVVRLALGVSALGAIAAGLAYATVPDGAGVIHACYGNRDGGLRVVDTEAGQSCNAREATLTWNHQGPVGPQGPAGAQGPRGDSLLVAAGDFDTSGAARFQVGGLSARLQEPAVYSLQFDGFDSSRAYVVSGTVRADESGQYTFELLGIDDTGVTVRVSRVGNTSVTAPLGFIVEISDLTFLTAANAERAALPAGWSATRSRAFHAAPNEGVRR
jgi:hypothetical protein